MFWRQRPKITRVHKWGGGDPTHPEELSKGGATPGKSQGRGKKASLSEGKGGRGITSQGALQIGGKGIQKGGTGIIEHDRIL